MVKRFTPYEKASLMGLIPALQDGMPGDTAMALFQGTMSDAQARVAQRQERQHSVVGGLQDQALQLLASGADPTAVEGIIGSLAGNYDFLGDNQSKYGATALDGLQGLISAGSNLMPGPQIDATDLDHIEEVVAAAQPANASYGSGAYHNALMDITGRLRTLGYDDAQIEQVKSYFDQRWTDAGGPPASGAPGHTPGEDYAEGPAAIGSLLGGGAAGYLGGKLLNKLFGVEAPLPEVTPEFPGAPGPNLPPAPSAPVAPNMPPAPGPAPGTAPPGATPSGMPGGIKWAPNEASRPSLGAMLRSLPAESTPTSQVGAGAPPPATAPRGLPAESVGMGSATEGLGALAAIGPMLTDAMGQQQERLGGYGDPSLPPEVNDFISNLGLQMFQYVGQDGLGHIPVNGQMITFDPSAFIPRTR